MAPNTIRTATHTTIDNMSNPNSAALAVALRNRNGTKRNSSSSGRTVYIGKDMQPIYLPQMKSINSYTWQKASSFGTLFDTISNLVDAHSVADVISLVSTELPIDTRVQHIRRPSWRAKVFWTQFWKLVTWNL